MGAEHISKEEVAKLDRIQPREEQAPNCIQKPEPRAVVYEWKWVKKGDGRKSEQNDWVVDEHGRHSVLREVDPQKESEDEKEEAWQLD